MRRSHGWTRTFTFCSSTRNFTASGVRGQRLSQTLRGSSRRIPIVRAGLCRPRERNDAIDRDLALAKAGKGIAGGMLEAGNRAVAAECHIIGEHGRSARTRKRRHARRQRVKVGLLKEGRRAAQPLMVTSDCSVCEPCPRSSSFLCSFVAPRLAPMPMPGVDAIDSPRR